MTIAQTLKRGKPVKIEVKCKKDEKENGKEFGFGAGHDLVSFLTNSQVLTSDAIVKNFFTLY